MLVITKEDLSYIDKIGKSYVVNFVLTRRRIHEIIVLVITKENLSYTDKIDKSYVVNIVITGDAIINHGFYTFIPLRLECSWYYSGASTVHSFVS